MVDYYSALLRAVTAPNAGDGEWRRGLYERARSMLTQRLRARRPPLSVVEIASEQAALDAAIKRVEAEMEWTEQDGIAPDRGPIEPPLRWRGTIWFALVLVAAALGASGFGYWAKTRTSHAPAPQPAQATDTSKDGDLPPGTEGGSSEADLPYVFRRQPTFYRTLEPVGTIIVDRLQHFLYLIQPNNVALRYGIAVGAQCTNLVGLRHIASVAEWPSWQPPPGLLDRNPNPMPGGPGNPLGARLLQLDDSTSRIHGTNAPKTIGSTVTFGCIRLVNDDIADLAGRVKVSTPVVVN
jgi:lipoprotein-anchoring transpeptidase ErfK/SrfK